MKRHPFIFMISMLAVAFACEGTARAWVVKTLPQQGTSYVGMINGVPTAVLKNQSNGCSQHILTPGWGLQDDVFLVGTRSSDTIFIVSSSTSFCNLTIDPLDTNGNYLGVLGDTGDDWLWNFGISAEMYGQEGNDTLVDFSGGYISGGLHNDFLYGVNGTDADGSAGDDTFCPASNQTLASAIGGSGWDSLCGPAASYTGIDSLACTCSLF
jgi:hypothetical protein